MIPSNAPLVGSLLGFGAKQLCWQRTDNVADQQYKFKTRYYLQGFEKKKKRHGT